MILVSVCIICFYLWLIHFCMHLVLKVREIGLGNE